MGYLNSFRLRNYVEIADPGQVRIGVIAQEVMIDHPELVEMGENGYYQVSGVNNWKLIKALQELSTENAELREAQLDQELRIDSLAKGLCVLGNADFCS